jgi:nitrite reductase/ring-hydroxylating ferredoxin subunit
LARSADFPEGETRLANFRNPVTTPWDGQTGDIPCWVRRIAGNDFQVFAINCAHLGCPVSWFAQSKLFLCPCHGGAYYEDGSRASGPPERGLFEYAHRIVGGSLDDPPARCLHLPRATALKPPLTQILPSDFEPRRTALDTGKDLDSEEPLMAGLKQRAVDVYNWFERRLGLGAPAIEAAEHEVPSSTSSWWYVFGSAATVILILQVVTGILLALVYAPTASHAWTSLEFLDHNVRLGWYLRALHGWGSDFMVAIVLIHMVQVFLFGAYKFPRELTWIVGVFLLLLTLGMAFTGQVLRFDQDAYWGLGIGASILSRVPSSAGRWLTSCWAVRSSLDQPSLASSRCMSSSFPGACLRWSACTFGWFCGSASMNGQCRDAW